LIFSGSATDEPPNFMTTVSELCSGAAVISGLLLARYSDGETRSTPARRPGPTTRLDYVSWLSCSRPGMRRQD
jgi:hypothetical protein